MTYEPTDAEKAAGHAKIEHLVDQLVDKASANFEQGCLDVNNMAENFAAQIPARDHQTARAIANAIAAEAILRLRRLR